MSHVVSCVLVQDHSEVGMVNPLPACQRRGGFPAKRSHQAMFRWKLVRVLRQPARGIREDILGSSSVAAVC